MIVMLCANLPIVNAEKIASPTTYSLWSVSMVDSNDGWAVGELGTIIHWNGTQWNIVTSPTTQILRSVFMINPNDGWAVGAWGTIIHWNGTQWSIVTSPTTTLLLKSVFMVSSDDGWAVGGDNFPASMAKTIIHWNGTQWSIVTSPTLQMLNSVFMVNPNDGWAVGYGGAIIHWAGAKWISEFPIATLMPILLILTLVAVILARNVKETRKCARTHSSANLKSSSLNFL